MLPLTDAAEALTQTKKKKKVSGTFNKPQVFLMASEQIRLRRLIILSTVDHLPELPQAIVLVPKPGPNSFYNFTTRTSKKTT